MSRVIRRALLVIPTLWLTMTIVFALILFVPGDPAVLIAGDNPAPGQVDAIREELGLNENPLIRYFHMFGGLLTGDLGTSLFSSQSVWSALQTRMPVTLWLALLAMIFSLLIGIPLGTLAGMRPGSKLDRFATLVASLGMALPSFWLGLILIIYFAIQWGWLPATGYVPMSDGLWPWLSHMLLPAVTLAMNPAAETTRQLRASMRDVMQQDFIRTAYSRGLPGRVVIVKHALRNSMIPVLSVIGVQTTHLMGGVVVIEAVFALPGVGSLAVDSVTTMDLPMVQGVVIFGVLIAIGVNLIVDILYSYADPKVRAA